LQRKLRATMSFRSPLQMKTMSLFNKKNQGSPSSSSSSPPSSADRKIQIVLHHNGIASRGPLIGQRKREVEEFLTEVWSQLGNVAKTYYYPDLRTVLVTFKSREQAFFALSSLKDPIEMSVAIQAAVGADCDRALLAKQLFVSLDEGAGNSVSASFAEEQPPAATAITP
jgi:hypothetical protein